MAKKSATKSAAAKNKETSTAIEGAETSARKTAVTKAPARQADAMKNAAEAKAKAAAAPAKKAARKPAAKKAAGTATTAATPPKAASQNTKPQSNNASVRQPRMASPIKPPAPVISAAGAPRHAAPEVVQSTDSGVIRPAHKRPAIAPPINATALYRQDRLLRTQGPDQRPFIRRDLPAEYGETRLSVLVRDANWLFMYWEIAASTRAQLDIPRGNHREQLVLRHHDMTGVAGDDVLSAVSYFDIMVTDQTSSWYVQVPLQGRRYIVELGIARADGAFASIARSGPVQMPRMEISEDLNWKLDDSFSDAHLQILQLSGGGADLIGRLGASEGMVSSLQSRLFSESAGFSASLFSGSLFSGEFASGALGHQVFAGKDRQFWLVVDAEVIVYGATEPDARVKFMGREIKLNPDGTFGIRMALPDASIDFPVEATSADGEETRKVCPVVSRKTV